MCLSANLFDVFDYLRVLGRYIVLLRQIVVEIVEFYHRLLTARNVQTFSFPITEADFLKTTFGMGKFPVKIFVLFLVLWMIKEGREE